MRFPFTISRREKIEELEHRADSSYTDALVASLVHQAQAGKAANLYATAALEACAGRVGRSAACAERPTGAYINPRSFMLRKSSQLMMTWSSTSMPRISPTCTSRRVRLRSSWLGDTSPDG